MMAVRTIGIPQTRSTPFQCCLIVPNRIPLRFHDPQVSKRANAKARRSRYHINQRMVLIFSGKYRHVSCISQDGIARYARVITAPRQSHSSRDSRFVSISSICSPTPSIVPADSNGSVIIVQGIHLHGVCGHFHIKFLIVIFLFFCQTQERWVGSSRARPQPSLRLSQNSVSANPVPAWRVS